EYRYRCAVDRTWPGQRRAAEVQRISRFVGYDLHRIRVEQFFTVRDLLEQRRYAGLRMLLQVVRHLIDGRRRNQRLVPLHIDDDLLLTQVETARNFLDAIGARLVIG